MVSGVQSCELNLTVPMCAALAADFVFVKPGYFTFGKDYYFLSQSINRFAAGQLSAEGLLSELDRVVVMMEQEGGG